MKILIRVAIIAAVIAGGFVLRDRLSGNYSDLKVGDCFDDPKASTNISDVQHHPCSEPHTGEVFFVGDHPAAKGTPFTQSSLISFVGTSCDPAFTRYLGSSDFEGLDFGAFYPSDKDWDSGQRGITCYLYRVDGSPMTKSLKAV